MLILDDVATVRTLEEKYWLMGDIALPIASTSFFVAFALKPKRKDVWYMRFLYFHFFSFAIAAELFASFGHFRNPCNGEYVAIGLFALARIPLCCLLFRQTLKLRQSAALLPPEELNEFLCQTVLVKGAAAMGPMAFFTFEAVACFLRQNSLDNGMCKDTTNAAVFLSVHLTAATALSIFTKALPKKVQKVESWSYAAIATLDLPPWQKLQGLLAIIVGLCSLFLLTALGTEGEEDKYVGIAGATGLVCAALNTLIGMFKVASTNDKQRPVMAGDNNNSDKSLGQGRTISVGGVQEGLFWGAIWEEFQGVSSKKLQQDGAVGIKE